jgi:hypothetical protein
MRRSKRPEPPEMAAIRRYCPQTAREIEDRWAREEAEAEAKRRPVSTGTQRAMYVGSVSPALRGRTALVMVKRAGILMAQFDWPDWQQFNEKGRPIEPVDSFCLGWHEFTEGEFQVMGEGWGEREDREQRELTRQNRAHRRALADFGGEPGSVPESRWDPIWNPGDQEVDDEWEYGMDHLVGLDGWGSD